MTRARRGERREAKKVTLYYDSVSPRQSTINIRELNGIFIFARATLYISS